MPINKALMKSIASLTFDQFGDIVTPTVSLISKELSHSTTTLETTPTNVAYPIDQCALLRFNRNEIGAPLQGERGALLSNRTLIEESDRKAIFQQSELPDGVVPNVKHLLSINGSEWTILGVAKDPADATWNLHIRER